jgi:hypothetical protein
MITELDILNEWIPEQMLPGTLFLLEHAAVTGEDAEDAYCAVLACPCCGTLGLITRRQMSGALPVICGSNLCSAQFFLRNQHVLVCEPN